MRFFHHCFACLFWVLACQASLAQEPIRTWRMLQGLDLRGHLVAFRPGKIFVEDEQGVVHEIELQELNGESLKEIIGVGRVQPLAPWQTPVERDYLADVKRRIHHSGIVNVTSQSFPLYELGFVVGTDAGYSYVLCEPTSENFPLAQTIPGSPASILDELQMQVTYVKNETKQVSDARFHASYPGRVVLKSPFRLANGNAAVLAEEELDVGETICLVQRDKSSSETFMYHLGWIQQRNSSPQSTGDLLSYTLRSESNNIEGGAIAVNREGLVLGVISKPKFRRYAKRTRKPLSSHGYDYVFIPSAILRAQLQPQLLALLSKPVGENIADFAALYVDPFRQILSVQFILNEYDPATRFRMNAFSRDGENTPSLVNASGCSLTSKSYPSTLQRDVKLPTYVDVLSTKCDMTGIKPADHVLLYAQVEFTTKDKQTRYSRMILVNFKSDLGRYRKEFALRNETLLNLSRASQTQIR